MREQNIGFEYLKVYENMGTYDVQTNFKKYWRDQIDVFEMHRFEKEAFSVNYERKPNQNKKTNALVD